MYNFQPQNAFYSAYPNRCEIVRVNGENGARAYNIAPNSNALLLDETAPIVWLVQTDGAGYKSITPYKIEPYEAPAMPDYGSLEARIKALEERLTNESNPSKSTAKKSGNIAE